MCGLHNCVTVFDRRENVLIQVITKIFHLTSVIWVLTQLHSKWKGVMRSLRDQTLTVTGLCSAFIDTLL